MEENPEISENSVAETLDESIEASKPTDAKKSRGRPPLPKPEKVYKKKEVDPDKPKRVQSEAQKASFAKAREALEKKRAERLAEKEKILKQAEEIRAQAEVKAKKNVEEKLVKKAVAIKKQQIKKEKMIEEVLSDSDDEEIMNEVKEFVARRKVEKKMGGDTPKPVTKSGMPSAKKTVVQESPKPLFRFV